MSGKQKMIGILEKLFDESFLASRTPSLYNSPSKSLRPFSADYPHGAQADGAGRLLKSIDGHDLAGALVVGRRMVGGADEALSPTEFDALTKAITGRSAEIVAPGSAGLKRNEVGSVSVQELTKSPLGVLLSNKLTPQQLPNVYAHELGHVIDQAAGEMQIIPMAGKQTKLDDSSKASMGTTSPEVLSWAEEWLAERTKPSRKQNLTPSQRQSWARLLRSLRSPDTNWAVSPSIGSAADRKASRSQTS
jgi:hypothetical protein